MRQLFLTLIISLLFLSLNKAQDFKKVNDLSNSLYDLWVNGNIEKAMESSLELYQINPTMFIERIHNTLGQQLPEDSKLYGYKYLEQMFLKKNKEINKIIVPIFLWSKAINAKDESELKKVIREVNKILTDSSNYVSMAERYGLLILQELDKKKAIDAAEKEKILIKIISNLRAYPHLGDMVSGRVEGEKRAWYRYILAYSYYYLYTIKTDKEEYLKKASDYSPDQNDSQYNYSFFYDAALLTGNTNDVGFKQLYKKYLIDNHRVSESLNLLCEIAFLNPTDNNIKSLQDYYEKTNNEETFHNYWGNYIYKMGKPVPMVKIKFENEELDLTQKPDHWIYIDIWGTWCGPCREELPKLQSFFTENRDNTNSDLKIYTFSVNSKDLLNFMTSNKYTFPVSEIDKQTSDSFEVTVYPTKILVSPDGNYVQIPFGVDWKMYIKNYTLMKI